VIDFFDYYGVFLSPASEMSKDQYKGDCPFCGKEKHFYVDPTKGLFDCKKCGAEGNNLTFITDLHKMYLETTKDEDYLNLASLRPGVTADALKSAEFALDRDSGTWYVPYQNGSKYLNNLGKFNPDNGFRIYKGPGLGLKLYRPFDKKSFQETVVICEGEWDLLSIYSHMKECEPNFSICAVPGSNTFKDEYLENFKGKNVILMYDKDDAGKKGIAKVSRKLNDVAASIRFLKWDTDEKFSSAEGEEDLGKDLRDFVVSKTTEHKGMTAKRKPKLSTMIWGAIILQCISPETDQGTTDSYLSERFSLPPVATVTSWEDYIKVFRDNLYLTPSNEHALACVLSTSISPHFPGEPIWLFLVGPASSGKTTLIESFGDSNMYVDAQSEISARSLVSGYKTSDGKDISYLPTLNNRTLMIKDFTTILTKSAQEQDELFGILRDAFDGSYKKQYGNNQHRFYKDLKFGLVAGVTKAIHAQNRSSLGERFLKIEYLDKSEFDEYLHIQSAMSSVSTKAQRTKILIEHSLGYLDYLMNNLPDFLPNLNGRFEYKISHLAMLVARLRSQVERRRDESLLYRPEWEVASRLAVQFKKMAQCLMIVYNKTEPDNQLYLTIRKLAIDSCIPFNIEFAKRMYAYPDGITRNDLAEQLQLPATNVHRLLTDLMQLGLIRMKQIKAGKVGRPVELYYLDYNVQKLWAKSVEEDYNDNPLPPEPLKQEIPRRIRRQKV
jgi:5S rRNA maturation endonuclease (ribonuclease M5)/GTPase SAR1 family protein/ribosomal protein L37AE/L43A